MVSPEPVAVIGLDCMFPGDAGTSAGFYDMLQKGKSGRSDIPGSRWNANAFYHPDPSRAGSTYFRTGHYLTADLETFDAPFFSLSAAEAECMDPQQRFLLEVTYKALENAGISLQQIGGSNTSVYVGAFSHDFGESLLVKDPDVKLRYGGTGRIGLMLSNRISWFYDLKGPSMTIETGCSASLTALHLAVQSLRKGESSTAIVGGCSLFQSPESSIILSQGGVLGPDGKSYSLDHKANGYSRGEGFAVVVLKRLVDAIHDQDVIRAIIRNTGCNQDGKSPIITQPTSEAQIALMRSVYAEARLNPASTAYFEAHATGTPVGDPIEIHAISSVFSKHLTKQNPLYVGSVKSNIGHGEAVAGLAGLIKAIFIVENGLIPPTLWWERWPSSVVIDQDLFKVPTTLIPWSRSGLRRVSINSFGVGGSNTHVIVDDAISYLQSQGLEGFHRTKTLSTLSYPDTCVLNGSMSPPSESQVKHRGCSFSTSNIIPEGQADEEEWRVFVLSSFDEDGVKRLANAYHDHLKRITCDLDKEFLNDLAFTLATKRSIFPWRKSLVANSVPSLIQSLESPSRAFRVNYRPGLAFIFTGQGAQWKGMGKQLMFHEPFRESMLAASKYLNSLGSTWSLEDVVSDADSSLDINDPMICQSTVTAIQIALAELLRSWAVTPNAVLGHSSGEIAAACVAGAISREDAWRLAYYRGLLSSTLRNEQKKSGGMIAISLSAHDVQPYLDTVNSLSYEDSVGIGCINSQRNVTVSGEESLINKLASLLQEDGVFCRILKVTNAYHSPYMQSIADEYSRLVGEISIGVAREETNAPRFYSSLRGVEIDTESLRDMRYWVDNMVSLVKFYPALSLMLAKKLTTSNDNRSMHLQISEILEIGPHAALQGPIREILHVSPEAQDIQYLSMLRRGQSAVFTGLQIAGCLFERGYPIKMDEVVRQTRYERLPVMLVDLPGYEFNHSQSYSQESRLSKQYRLRKFPRHDLLGAPASDWDPRNAVWTNWLRTEEIPWIKHHVVTGVAVYPGAGMLIMALEASRQIADSSRLVTGFQFRDVSFHATLTIPSDNQAVETRLHIHPVWNDTSSQLALWNQFELCSYQHDSWQSHCRGLIQTKYASPPTEVDNGLEDHEHDISCALKVENAERLCLDLLTDDQVYYAFEEAGLRYGSTFRGLSDVGVSGDGCAVATVTAADIASIMPASFMQPHIIHPSTLDSALQAVLVAASHRNHEDRALGPAVPTYIEDMWISANNGTSFPAIRLLANAKVHESNQRVEAEITAVALNSRQPLFTASNIVCTSVAYQDEFANTCIQTLCWKPDVSFLSSRNARKALCSQSQVVSQPSMGDSLELKALIYAYLRRYLEKGQSVASERPHFLNYQTWAKTLVDDWPTKEMPEIAPLEAQLGDVSAATRLVIEVGRHLDQILRAEQDPLELLYGEKKLAEKAYTEIQGNELAVAFVSASAYKNPSLKILEIGAGTGTLTAQILDGLRGTKQPNFERYVFTDISAAFLPAAQERFKDFGSHIQFELLNIEEDPETQGFRGEEYDIVVAALVIHATASINDTLRNIRKLLKPGGKLLIVETTNEVNALSMSFSFGLLSGWWRSNEPWRQRGPLLSTEQWNSSFLESGYSGIDFDFPDNVDSKYHANSILITTALADSKPYCPIAGIVIIAKADVPSQWNLALRLQQLLMSTASETKLLSFEDLHTETVQDRVCIFLPEMDSSILQDPSPTSFHDIQSMIGSSSGVLWVTVGGGPVPTRPEAELVSGFARTVRTENSLRFVTLSLAEADKSEAETWICSVLDATLGPSPDFTVVDDTFCTNDHVLCIPRLLYTDSWPCQLAEKGPRPTLLSSRDNLVVEIGQQGLIDSFRFRDSHIRSQPLAPGQVEIQVKAASLNFRDVLIALNRLTKHRYPMGNEAAGVVTRSNSPHFAVNDRVYGIVETCSYANYARTSDSLLATVPGSLSLAEAATLPTAFCTAYLALYDYARIQKGERVLIHDAAGGLGQACVQLAQLAGAEIFATVGSMAKCKLLMETYGLARDHIFSSRDLTFAEGVKRMTNGKGVEVVINSLSGAALRATWDCIATWGRFVETGKADILSGSYLPMRNFQNNVSFRLIDLEQIYMEAPKLSEETLLKVRDLVQQGKLRSIQPINKFPLSKLTDAFHLMQTGNHSGKIVVEPQGDDFVSALPPAEVPWSFDPRASFLIAGGLGGIGRGVSRWMAKKGARHLVLLSRSGPKSSSARALISRLEAQGVRVFAPPCDIADAKAFQKVLETCVSTMPPIKGCINASMVLQPALVATMSIDQYRAVTRPKVSGAHNIQLYLPSDKDFCITIASAIGMIGEPGQAAYSASSTFQDSMARHMVIRGQRAITIDLGLMNTIGYAAEQSERRDHLRERGILSMAPQELYRFLDDACNPSLPIPTVDNAQVILGFRLRQDLRITSDQNSLQANPILSHMTRMSSGTIRAEGNVYEDREDIVKSLETSQSASEASSIISNAVSRKILHTLRIDVDPEIPASLGSFGIDSLVAIELSSWLRKDFNATISVIEVVNSQGIQGLVDLILNRSSLLQRFKE